MLSGKIAVPLSVMNKATRLDGKEKYIRDRLENICLRAQIMMMEGKKDEAWYKDVEEKTGRRPGLSIR